MAAHSEVEFQLRRDEDPVNPFASGPAPKKKPARNTPQRGSTAKSRAPAKSNKVEEMKKKESKGHFAQSLKGLPNNISLFESQKNQFRVF